MTKATKRPGPSGPVGSCAVVLQVSHDGAGKVVHRIHVQAVVVIVS